MYLDVLSRNGEESFNTFSSPDPVRANSPLVAMTINSSLYLLDIDDLYTKHDSVKIRGGANESWRILVEVVWACGMKIGARCRREGDGNGNRHTRKYLDRVRGDIKEKAFSRGEV